MLNPDNPVVVTMAALLALSAGYVTLTRLFRFFRDVYHAWLWIGHTKDEAFEGLRDIRTSALMSMKEFQANGGRTEEPQNDTEREAARNATMKDLQLDNRALLRRLSRQLEDHDGWAHYVEDQRQALQQASAVEDAVD